MSTSQRPEGAAPPAEAPGPSPRARRSWPLRVYLIGLVAIFVVAAAVNVGYQRSSALNQARQTAVADARFAAALAARDLAAAAVQLQKADVSVAATPGVATILTSRGACTLSFSVSSPFTTGHLDIVGRDGTVACSSLSRTAARQYRGASWLSSTRTTPLLAGPLVDARTGRQVLVITAPVDGRGVVAAFVDLGPLGPSLAARLGGPLHLAFLVTSPDGRRVVARSTDPRRWVGASLTGAALPRTASQTSQADLNGVPSLYGEAAAGTLGWRVFASIPTATALAAANGTSDRQLIITLAGLGLFLAALWVIYRRITRPISRLSAGVRAATARTAGEPIDVRGPSEVATLAEDFNSLIAAAGRELELASRLGAIIESSSDAIVGMTTDGVVTSWNRAAEEMYGYTASEMTGRDAVSTITPAARAAEMTARLAKIRDGDQVDPLETQAVRKDGSLLDVSVTLSPVRGPGGVVTGISSVSRDISPRKRTEAEDQERELRLLADRDRIARGLHDTVVRQIFATGLSLASTSQLIADGNARRRVEGSLNELDGVIRQIRNVVFTGSRARRPATTRELVLDLTRQAARKLGFEPSVTFAGPLEELPEYVADQLLATLRESLANLIRQASASHAEIEITIGQDVTLTVRDDGAVIDPAGQPGGVGLAGMQARAEQLGGRLTAQPGSTGGTRMEWRVPLPAATSSA